MTSSAFRSALSRSGLAFAPRLASALCLSTALTAGALVGPAFAQPAREAPPSVKDAKEAVKDAKDAAKDAKAAAREKRDSAKEAAGQKDDARERPGRGREERARGAEQKPAAEPRPERKPAEAPAAKSDDKPTAKPAEKPAAEKPAAKPAGKPAPERAAEPPAKPAAKPAAKPDVKSEAKPGARPESRGESKPADRASDAPAGKPGESPARRAGERIQKTDEAPAQDSTKGAASRKDSESARDADRERDRDRDRDRAGGRERDGDRDRADRDRARDERGDRGRDRDETSGRDARRGGEPDAIQDVRRQRRERKEGGRTIIVEPDRREITREGGRLIIRHDEAARFRRFDRDARVERGPGGVTRTIVTRPNGVRIITVTDEQGRLVRRIRRAPDGREVVIIDNRRSDRGPQRGFIEIAPPRITIPRERYILETDRAQPQDVLEVLRAPPVQAVERAYTLEEIRQTPNLRARMPRVDLDTITFDTGSWEIEQAQARMLQAVADGMKNIIERNPDEVFLIEGHTDAVGSDIDNLSLSDRRAESVALTLSEEFGVPPENLTTQGFGEEQLKVQTESAERANRRVTVRRITPLLQGQRTR